VLSAVFKVKFLTVPVKRGDDLYDKSKGREIYNGYIINDIYCEAGNEYVDFTSKPDILRIGKVFGDIDDIVLKEQQIKKTIEEHLNKELALKSKGIKVLSLFFIDRVANYRFYDENGIAQKGKYAKLFEKNYNELIKKPKYNILFKDIDIDVLAEEVHNGYFSADKKGILKDTNGNTLADNNAYTLIMKDKEKLLSFETKLKFIFSHSALREGWDNPNVFQICTLNETKSEVKKRQEIGRGLRLCVNQDGERLYGSNINVLTVMANESYEDFAKALQNEIERDQGIKFGVLEAHYFANISVINKDGTTNYIGQESSEKIHKFFEQKGYIDKNGKVQDALKTALRNNNLELPNDFKHCQGDITALVKKVSGNINIKNADEKRKISVNKEVFLSPEFKELWNKIKYKTTYSVDYDSKELIQKCCNEMRLSISIDSAKLIFTKAKLEHSISGIGTNENDRTAVTISNEEDNLPDIVSFLQNETNLTRKTIVEILINSDTLNLFKKNPQKYMDEVSKIIKTQMRLLLVDGIKYTKIGDNEFYAQELFNENELFGYLSKNMIESKYSVYDYIVFDSQNEENFARKFESNKRIKLYVKLPSWFKIFTPIGSYNPDWAVLVERENEQKLYFVIETKANILKSSLRQTEIDKIKCGHKHFEALGNLAVFKETDNFEKFIENI